MTSEEIIEKQGERISQLQKEILSLKESNDNKYDSQTVYALQEEIFMMHSKIGELYLDNDSLRAEKEQLQEHISALINSRSWKATQWIRNIIWMAKGNR